MKNVLKWVFTLGILPLIDRIAANRRAKREQEARLLREKQEAEKKSNRGRFCEHLSTGFYQKKIKLRRRGKK